MLADGFRGIDAVALQIVMRPELARVWRRSRGWSDAEWAEAQERLRAGGWVETGEDGSLVMSEQGRIRREALEQRTDELAAPAYTPIGTEGCERLVAFGGTLRQAIEAAGLTLRI